MSASCRIRAVEHPLWSSFVWRNEVSDTFVETVAAPWFARAASGTPVMNLCERYADAFPRNDRRNILLCGEGGLGKTFLLNCIFERVTSRGFSAVRITAFRMFEAMRQQHLSNDDKFDGFSALIEAPLLLIDDLGTEPMMRNITVEYLFTLLNERAAAKRHTVVATNQIGRASCRERV